MFSRICRDNFPQQEVFPCQVSALDTSSSGNGSVKKKLQLFLLVAWFALFFSVIEMYFTLLFHSVVKTG